MELVREVGIVLLGSSDVPGRHTSFACVSPFSSCIWRKHIVLLSSDIMRDMEEKGSKEQDNNIALYRKYRPQSFADIRGQEHVTKALEWCGKKERHSACTFICRISRYRKDEYCPNILHL